MTLASTTNRLVDRVGDAYDSVVGRLKIAADEVRDALPFDAALNSLAGVLGERYDVDELLARIDSLEGQIRLLQSRDETLSRTMRKLDEEQRLAARIQQDFLPKSMPQVGPFTFQAIYRPAHYVSGDLYDVKRLDEQNVGLYVADAVGHGMPAALLTMFMKNALLTKRIFEGGYELLRPAETIAALNTALRSQNLDHASFATAVYARVNCVTGEICFSSGGHPTPVILRADGTIDEVSADGALLGVFDDNEWSEGCIKLHPGDRLFLYSDGIESTFASGDTPDSLNWKQALAERRDRSTHEILTDFALALESQDPALPKDDLTIVVAEVART
jgi:phosphoserine phosphatase RsbU/P